MKKQHDRTLAAVTKQLQGMGCEHYEIGIRHPERGMQIRECSAEDVIRAVPRLKAENARGANIYIRPARSQPSRLVLVDDINLGALDKMRAAGHAPAVVTETSPANLQVWVKLDCNASPGVRAQIARQLARDYGGDPNSTDAQHFGRLAGFTNRKPSRVDALGRSPFVLLESYAGSVAPAAAALAQAAAQALAQRAQPVPAPAVRQLGEQVAESAQAMPEPGHRDDLAVWYRATLASIAERCGRDDLSRADWAIAVAMFTCKQRYGDVAAVIREHSPALAIRKSGHADDYVLRTAGKAEVWAELRSQGAAYNGVKDRLLPLAEQRQQERAAAPVPTPAPAAALEDELEL